jgi:acyl-CoA reductase-like NAD-dependent aldehyde dehydrogenase
MSPSPPRRSASSPNVPTKKVAMCPDRREPDRIILSEPQGVVGAITPWNSPIAMAGWKLGRALAAGDAIIIKPLAMTLFPTLLLAGLAKRAGVPVGLIHIVLGDGRRTGNARGHLR